MDRKSKSAEFSQDGYNIDVHGRNVTVTEGIKNYAIEKVSKIEKFAHRIIDVSVILDIQKVEHRVDIVMQVDHIKIKSSAVSNDLYASIDIACDKLQQRLLKYKKRIQEHTAKPISMIEMNVNVMEHDVDEINDEIESETRRQLYDSYAPHKVSFTEKKPLKTLNQNEAIMRFELSGDNFLIYNSEEDKRIKVIYRRKEGNLGIIEVVN